MAEKNRADRVVSIFLRFKDCVRKYKQRLTDGKKVFVVLGSLSEYQRRTGRPVTVTEISRISGLALPNVSRVLLPLEQEGLVYREKNGRTVSVLITEKGNSLLDRLRSEFVRDLTEALDTLSEEQTEAFIESGEKILTRLENNFKNNPAGDNRC